MKMLLRLLAFVCDICPFCVAARRFPNSGFARGMKALEKFCPFCRARQNIRHNASGNTEKKT